MLAYIEAHFIRQPPSPSLFPPSSVSLQRRRYPFFSPSSAPTLPVFSLRCCRFSGFVCAFLFSRYLLVCLFFSQRRASIFPFPCVFFFNALFLSSLAADSFLPSGCAGPSPGGSGVSQALRCFADKNHFLELPSVYVFCWNVCHCHGTYPGRSFLPPPTDYASYPPKTHRGTLSSAISSLLEPNQHP